MALELSKKEKTRIFWDLLKQYPDYARQRTMISLYDTTDQEKANFTKMINQEEKEAYDIIVKFGKEIGQDVPEYSTPK